MRWYELYERVKPISTSEEYDNLFKKITMIPPEKFQYRVEPLNGRYAIVDDLTNIIVYQTLDENEADYLCDSFNHDKDNGKDALIHSLKINKEKFII